MLCVIAAGAMPAATHGQEIPAGPELLLGSGAPAVPDPQVFHSRIGPLTDAISRAGVDPRPRTPDGNLRILDWLLWGDLTAGTLYDSNVNRTAADRTAAFGASVRPAIVALRHTGIHKTLLYGAGDMRYYPTEQLVRLDNTRAGLVHVWEIQRDFIYRVQGEATRGEEFSAFVPTLPGLGVPESAVDYTRLFGSTSIEKGFGRLFTAVGGSITRSEYDDARDIFGNVIDESFRNGSVSTLNGRMGYHVTPIVYTFVEPSMNWARYDSPLLDSEGYRLTAGVGSARISLFNGELYGGYVSQSYQDPAIGTVSGAIYGGRLSWYPTRFITVTGSVDQSFGTSDFRPAFGQVSPTWINSAKLAGTWDVTRSWSLSGAVEHRNYEYLGSTRIDNLWRLTAAVTYFLTSRFGISLDYAHAILDSNVPLAGYTRDVVSIGGRTRF
jgi:hypothetical protein